MHDEHKDLWILIIDLIERNADRNFTDNANYLAATTKILTKEYKSISNKEYHALLYAIKSAEHNANLYGYPTVAWMFRRILFHSAEEGLYEFAYLKDQYGGCYIATAVYGSYNAPEVLLLRKFRDLYLDKRSWGQRFIATYYKYSPTFANKLKDKPIINGVVKFFFDRYLLKFAKKKVLENEKSKY